MGVKTQFVPARGFVLVKRSERDKMSKGGIVLPDNRQRDLIVQGKVVGVGPDRYSPDGSRTIPSLVKPNDEVLFKEFESVTITLDGDDYLVLEERNVLGILEKE